MSKKYNPSKNPTEESKKHHDESEACVKPDFLRNTILRYAMRDYTREIYMFTLDDSMVSRHVFGVPKADWHKVH